MSNPGIVIIGSGLAGYTLARELRKLDADKAITVVSRDDGAAYYKPALSNAVAMGKSPDALVQKTAGQMSEDLKLRVLALHTVEAIDRVAKQVQVRDAAGGQSGVVAYESLVLALGADPRPYTVPGAEPGQIHTVNDLTAYRAWVAGLAANAKILLVGAGLVGSEFANDLALGGYAVTVVDPAPWPLGRLLPEDLGRELATAMQDAGIALHLNRSLRNIADGTAILDDGTAIAFDRILSAIGLVPRIGLASDAGLAVSRGIVVDALLRTSDPSIYALGDCAETSAGPLPFVLPLMAEARALAATLAGQGSPLAMPAMPVSVKTPCLPLVVCPPPGGAPGAWHIEGNGRDRKALFQGPDGTPLGFALSGARVAEKTALGKFMPPLIATAA